MDKIKNFLVKFVNGEIIGTDKMLHFAFSYIIISLFNNIYLGLTAVTIVAILKETFDKKIKQTKFDTNDIIAGLLGAIFYTLINYLKNL